MTNNAASSLKGLGTFDLCVVGAGIAGLNALFVATEYLPKNARVLLIDRKLECGGMWNATYDFVRLHQPYEMFTTGDVRWNLKKPPEYLATGSEVMAHLRYCMAKIRQRIDLTEVYGHNVDELEEIETLEGPRVLVRHHAVSGGHEPNQFRAKRVVHALGLDIPKIEPLKLTSQNVISATPELLGQQDYVSNETPAYVVGGGKTGMDTVLELLNKNPKRKITLINGTGTVFANRDLFLPAGRRRWWHGKPALDILRDVSIRYSGANAEEVFDYFCEMYALTPGGNGNRFLFAYMSEDESRRISNGVNQFVEGYFCDIVETKAGPKMLLRDGAAISVEPGALIVNCTGYVLKNKKKQAPILSQNGLILTISSRNAIHFLTSVSAYFLSHLFFSNKLREADLYSIDTHTLFRKDAKEWAMAVTTLAFRNTICLIDALPMRVMNRCGLDLDKWYPLPRRIGGFVNIVSKKRHYLEHCRRSLECVAGRHGVQCGPMADLGA